MPIRNCGKTNSGKTYRERKTNKSTQSKNKIILNGLQDNQRFAGADNDTLNLKDCELWIGGKDENSI